MNRLGTRADWLFGVPLTTSAVLLLAVPRRTDLPGHYLAGFGATLMIVWLVALASRGRPWALVITCLACILVGHHVEKSIFPLAGYDIMDVAAQSGGALVAGAALVIGEAGHPDEDWFDAATLRTSGYGRLIVLTALASLACGTALALR